MIPFLKKDDDYLMKILLNKIHSIVKLNRLTT